MNSGTADWISGSKTLAKSSRRSAKVATTSHFAQSSNAALIPPSIPSSLLPVKAAMPRR